MSLDLGRVRRVDVGGSPLAVREWGDEGGRPLVFVHSLGPSSSAAFLGLAAEPLVQAGFHLVAMDLPGFGESPPLPADEYDVGRLAERVWAVADAYGIDRTVIMGHSWGGAIGCLATAAHPDRVEALVLVDSGHLDWGESDPEMLAKPLEEMVRFSEGLRLRAPDLAAIAAELEVSEDDPLVEAFAVGLIDDGEGGLISRTTGESRGAAAYHAARSRPSLTWATITEHGVPTLLLLATMPEDRLALNEGALERFQAAMPKAEVELVEGASHSMITDLRDRFGALVADWLASTSA